MLKLTAEKVYQIGILAFQEFKQVQNCSAYELPYLCFQKLEMKRFIVIVFLFIYIVPAIGCNINVHYCGGEVASISINPVIDSETCVCGSKKMDKDCCKDKQMSFKLKAEHQKYSQTAFDLFHSFDAALETSIPEYRFDFYALDAQINWYHYHHPPDSVRQALHILHQVFII